MIRRILNAMRGQLSPNDASAKRMVAMFHVGRTGSTVLGGLLDQNEHIRWGHEIYLDIMRTYADQPLQRGDYDPAVDPIERVRERAAAAGRDWFGFEVKFVHLFPFDLTLPRYIDALGEVGVTHFILLERRNHMRKIVSNHVRRRTGTTHHGKDAKATLTRVRVDVDNVRIPRNRDISLVDCLREFTRDFEQARTLLADRPLLELTYEDDIQDDPRVAYRRVCEFLGVEPATVEVELGRTNPFPVRDIIENFDDVAAALAGTEFAWMLDE